MELARHHRKNISKIDHFGYIFFWIYFSDFRTYTSQYYVRTIIWVAQPTRVSKQTQ